MDGLDLKEMENVLRADFTPHNAQVESKQKNSAAIVALSPPSNETSLKSKDQRVAELSGLVFEALSAKDSAWYDVASFLHYRILHSGELEVRVRFSGFGNEEDEWVNVRKGIRERSIPLEPSECGNVNVGDLVLCFRESEEDALHCDAHIVEIERRMHDNTECTCVFAVRYDHDNTEGNVQLGSLCCRPAK